MCTLDMHMDTFPSKGSLRRMSSPSLNKPIRIEERKLNQDKSLKMQHFKSFTPDKDCECGTCFLLLSFSDKPGKSASWTFSSIVS